jgi:acyl-CoA thioesterase
MHPFVFATAWAEDPHEPKRGVLDESWYQGRGAFGGLIAALFLKACQSRVADRTRVPRTITVHFAAAAEAGPVEIHTTLEREGSRVSMLSARLLRDGKVVAFATATFAAPRSHAIEYQRVAMPNIPAAHEIVPMRHPMMPVFTQHFDMRFCLGSMPFSGATVPELGGWVAPHEPLVCDPSMALALLDSFPPAAMALANTPIAGASVDFTMSLFAELPLKNATPEDQFLLRNVSRISHQGYTEELRQLWAADGTYLGECRQLMALF